MPTPMEIATDVIPGGTALAGLVIVYIGGVTAAYASFPPGAQPAVRRRYLAKAWFAFLGTLLALLAAGLAVCAKWYGSEMLAIDAIEVLLAALAWSIAIALLAALEI